MSPKYDPKKEKTLAETNLDEIAERVRSLAPVAGSASFNKWADSYFAGRSIAWALAQTPKQTALEAWMARQSEVDRLRAACRWALDFAQSVGTSDPDDIETMASIERLSGELTAVLG